MAPHLPSSPALAPSSRVRADFDRIALLPEERWDHNRRYHPLLLRHVPARCEHALEVGCGTGAFARALAGRARHVLALDLSPMMVEVARARSAAYANLELRVADVRDHALPDAHFDCIASLTTLHHLPMDEILPRLARALRPGGTLVVLDLFAESGPAALLRAAVAMPLNAIAGLARNGRPRPPAGVRRVWEEHGRSDHYLRIEEVRDFARAFLPGARVRRHLFWRYSLVWQKPEAARVG